MRFVLALLGAVLVLFTVRPARAEEGTAELARAALDPLAKMVSVSTRSTRT